MRHLQKYKMCVNCLRVNSIFDKKYYRRIFPLVTSSLSFRHQYFFFVCSFILINLINFSILFGIHLVKAGGMRIVQHKTGHKDAPAKDLEDVTGLTVFIIN